MTHVVPDSSLPPMTRENLRSLAFHRAIVDKLRDDSDQVRAMAERNIVKLSRTHPNARHHFHQWRTLLAMSTEELIARLLEPSMEMRELRHCSPFAGVLNEQERCGVLETFRRERGLKPLRGAFALRVSQRNLGMAR